MFNGFNNKSRTIITPGESFLLKKNNYRNGYIVKCLGVKNYWPYWNSIYLSKFIHANKKKKKQIKSHIICRKSILKTE